MTTFQASSAGFLAASVLSNQREAVTVMKCHQSSTLNPYLAFVVGVAISSVGGINSQLTNAKLPAGYTHAGAAVVLKTIVASKAITSSVRGGHVEGHGRNYKDRDISTFILLAETGTFRFNI